MSQSDHPFVATLSQHRTYNTHYHLFDIESLPNSRQGVRRIFAIGVSLRG